MPTNVLLVENLNDLDFLKHDLLCVHLPVFISDDVEREGFEQQGANVCVSHLKTMALYTSF